MLQRAGREQPDLLHEEPPPADRLGVVAVRRWAFYPRWPKVGTRWLALGKQAPTSVVGRAHAATWLAGARGSSNG